MEEKRLRYLFQRYLEKAITKEEEAELIMILNDDELELKAAIDEVWIHSGNLAAAFSEEETSRVRKRLMADIRANSPLSSSNRRRRTLSIISVAASIVLIISVLFVFFFNRNKAELPEKQTVFQATPVSPGTDGAILTLDDGTEIVLDSLKDGIVARQSGNAIYMENGALQYKGNNQSESVRYNLVRTPKGRQFKLILPDGSQVWLNAASSIRYPISFTGKERSVSVTGEAYFDVVTNSHFPFVVSHQELKIVVTGTTFNVNTYDDENSRRVTLLEGALTVSAYNKVQQIEPGTQAIQTGERLVVSSNVNTDEVIAWKNGFFSFNNTHIQSLMRMLSRWYDVDVVYEGEVPVMKFGGEISRSTELQGVLDILTESNIKFRIENKQSADDSPKIIVSQ